MTAYMVVMLDTTDHEWVAEYRRKVPPLLEAAGGRYLAFSSAPQRLEGSGHLPETLVLISFPSMAAAQGFLDLPAYRPYGDARRKGAQTTIYVVEDVLPPG